MSTAGAASRTTTVLSLLAKTAQDKNKGNCQKNENNNISRGHLDTSFE